MRKKKYPFRKKESSVVPYDGVSYNTRFIYFNEQGNIELVAPCKENVTFDCLVIEDSLISDFIEGKRLYKDYSITYFQRLKQGVAINEEQLVTQSKIGFYVIPVSTNYENEITIEHYSNRWQIKSKHEILENEIVVYVALKTNINFLIRQLHFSKDKNYTEMFQFAEEKHLSTLSLITKAKHISYAVKEMNE